MRRPATWSCLLLCLLLVQVLSPLSSAWKSDDIIVTKDDTQAPLEFLSQLGISPIADVEHGWGDLSKGVSEVDLRFRDAAPILTSEWTDMTDKRSVNGWVVLQHEWPVPSNWIHELKAAGMDCRSFLPPTNFHCDVPNMRPDELSALDVIAVMRLDPTDKVHPNLPAMMLGAEEWETVGKDYGFMKIVLSGDELPDFQGVEIFSHSERWATVGSNNLGLANLAGNEQIEWIEPMPVYYYTNDAASGVINTSWVRSPTNMASLDSSWNTLTGNGVIVTVADSGIHNGVNNSEMHGDFSDHIKDIVSFTVPSWARSGYCSNGGVWDDGASDTHSHGTHVAGSVLGDGTNSTGSITGSAPNARLYFEAFEQACGSGYMLALPNNFQDFMDLGAENNTNIHTNSWGSQSCGTCWGEYDTGTMQIDTAGTTYPNMTILFAAGNDGADNNGDQDRDPDSIGAPATAKNVITVGASENNRSIIHTSGGSGSSASTDNISGMATFSSVGPTDDGRMKPDIAAPGTYILSTMSNYARISEKCGWGFLPASDPDSDHYCWMGGTSMATPLTAGAAAQLYEHLYDNIGHENVSSSLIKAIMTANANDMEGQYSSAAIGAGRDSPNNHEGWGRLNMRSAVQTSFLDNEGVETGEGRGFSFVIPATAPDLRITLAWTDPASTPVAGTNLVNELNLNIKKPDGSWVNDTDTLNNLIGQDFTNPASGLWEVHINGSSVPTGPQMFSLALSANYTLSNLTEDADVDGTVDDEDDCLNTFGFSTIDRKGCPDTDGDGYSDADGGWPAHPTGTADAFPADATQWENTDGDAYGDNPSGTTPDDCVSVSGTSTIDRTGCLDTDSDGYSDPSGGWTTANGADSCISISGASTVDRYGCTDTDGDGYSDADGVWLAHPAGLADAFPTEITQWADADGDGYGDNLAGANPDDCGGVSGTSTEDRDGCPDADGDGWSDPDGGWPAHPTGTADAFPTDPTQWLDTDGDGFGDDPSGNSADDCPTVAGSAIVSGSVGCPDTDSDGSPDNIDAFPNDSTQSEDQDGDGYGDNAGGNQPDGCPTESGDSNQNGVFGCPDTDRDGWGDIDDAFPNDKTQWSDTDGDGYGDNEAGTDGDDCKTQAGTSTIDKLGCPDADGDGWSDEGDDFDDQDTQWTDSDGDGYGDNPSPALLYDDCPTVAGTSTADRQGCLDSDGDTYSDPDNDWNYTHGADAFPDDATRWVDDDQDQFDDILEDDCDSELGNSTQDRKGCVDTDGDGWSDPGSGWSPADGADSFPNEPSQWSDADGDGFGDEPTGVNPDACTSSSGNSTLDRMGCPDTDGDGYSNADGVWLAHPAGAADAFPDDKTQWENQDGDGYGDNLSGNTPDDCPTVSGASSTGMYGCADSDGDGVPEADGVSWTIAVGADAFPDDSTQWNDSDGDGFGDNLEGTTGDACPTFPGDSVGGGHYGCIDSDGDTWGDDFDVFPTVKSQWADSDGDGYGDNVVYGAMMIDHWPSDPSKNVANVDLACTPDSVETTTNSNEEISISCTVSNDISLPIVVVLKWEYGDGIVATLKQRAVDLGASGSGDASASVTFSGRANTDGQLETSIFALEPGSTSPMDIESFIIHVAAVEINTTFYNNTTASDGEGWSELIPFDQSNPALVIPFLIAFVLSFAFIARRITVSRRRHNIKLADAASYSVEQDRMMITQSPRVLERPPPPLPPGINRPV